MRSSSIILLLVAVWACLFVPSEAHVRLLYTGVPIRNAAGPALDGAYSVSGPCGGVNKYGVQGITQVTSGTAMSLKIAYNGGHQSPQNAFHAAYVCDSKLVAGSTFDDSVLRGTSPITAASPGVIPLTNTNGAMTVPAPTSSTAGYVLAFTVPKVTSATNCVISLLDQNNWGGCVDVTILPSGSSSAPATQQQSMVAAYCDLMTASCTGVNAVWASRSLCMIDAANYTSAAAAGAVTTGDNFECRQNQASLVTKDNAATQCPLAGPKSTACTNPAGQTRADSPCFTYCKNLIATCPATSYRSYFTQSYDKTIQMRNCLQKCADSYIKSTGWEYGLGNNTACRISALAQGNCVDANPAGVGQCGLANPLIITADKLSAVYTTAPGQCDTPMQAAENTVAGCCCLSGSIEVIHVRGYTFSTIKTMNDWTMSGPMCGAGTVSIKNPINNSTSTATFSAPVAPPVFSFRAQQTKDTSLVDQTGSVTIAGDSFDFRLTMTTSGQGLIVLTNNNANKPRVCSTQAVVKSRIDTSAYTSPDGISAASQLASSSVVITLILAALVAFLARV